MLLHTTSVQTQGIRQKSNPSPKISRVPWVTCLWIPTDKDTPRMSGSVSDLSRYNFSHKNNFLKFHSKSITIGNYPFSWYIYRAKHRWKIIKIYAGAAATIINSYSIHSRPDGCTYQTKMTKPHKVMWRLFYLPVQPTAARSYYQNELTLTSVILKQSQMSRYNSIILDYLIQHRK